MVDAALDAGASWDYTTMKPDYTQTHPYVSFSERHAIILILATLSGIAAIGYTALGLTRTKAT